MKSADKNDVLDIFQSTLPLRGVTEPVHGVPFRQSISIHTPLAGSDCRVLLALPVEAISIHTPLAGSDAEG